MGSCISYFKNLNLFKKTIKEGIPYENIRNTLKPFDLVLFSGGDFFSCLIKYIEEKNIRTSKGGINRDIFSHVGMIVTSDIIDHSKILPGKIYILESTMSGKLGQNVYNINDDWFLGVQIRDFDVLVKEYDKPSNTKIAICGLNKYPTIDSNLKEKFTKLYLSLEGIRYDANILSLLSVFMKKLRPHRSQFERLTEDWLFCSELVALIYKTMGILPTNTDPKNVMPMDFLGVDNDEEKEGGIPLIVHIPPIVVTGTNKIK